MAQRLPPGTRLPDFNNSRPQPRPTPTERQSSDEASEPPTNTQYTDISSQQSRVSLSSTYSRSFIDFPDSLKIFILILQIAALIGLYGIIFTDFGQSIGYNYINSHVKGVIIFGLFIIILGIVSMIFRKNAGGSKIRLFFIIVAVLMYGNQLAFWCGHENILLTTFLTFLSAIPGYIMLSKAES